MGRELDLTRGRPASAPPATVRMSGEEMVRGMNTGDVASRADMVSSFLSMPAEEQARTIGLLRERARPIEDRAAALESEAARLASGVRRQHDDIAARARRAETEAGELYRRGQGLDEQITRAETSGNAAEAARLRTERENVREQWTEKETNLVVSEP